MILIMHKSYYLRVYSRNDSTSSIKFWVVEGNQIVPNGLICDEHSTNVSDILIIIEKRCAFSNLSYSSLEI